MHWPVPAARFRASLPAGLTIEEFDGTAWVGVIPFWMSGVSPRPLPPLPFVSRFPELNVRTYVRHGDRPGVWFLSLDAGNRLAAWVGRRLFHLPYRHARMTVHRDDDAVRYVSKRTSGHGFEARYAPAGPVAPSRPGTLEHWLTERYCLYAWPQSGGLHRAEIHHAPWPLQPAVVSVTRNAMLALHGIAEEGPAPLAHYARRLDVVVWPLAAVRNDEPRGRPSPVRADAG
jgi:hypothetical protein